MSIINIKQLPDSQSAYLNLLNEQQLADFLNQISPNRGELARYRADFYKLVFVCSGQLRYKQDFEPQRQQGASVNLLHPMQVIELDFSSDWQGYLLEFSPTLLPLDSDFLQDFQQWHGALPLNETQTDYFLHYIPLLNQAIKQSQNIQQHLLCALLSQIHLLQQQSQSPVRERISQKRVKQFRQLLEQQFRQHHHVATYSEQLACTKKSLTHACLTITGKSAKSLINQRIILEAKRLLAYSDLSVNQIGYQLGFNDNSHFGKFFKQQSGETAMGFRQNFLG
ncbi:helix-turn-helix domain-containing protein [Lonepinella sp. BR2271]|uniref:helix-turn-helix domain-containing protein n=1 Tax=Lonepinella sp. BR2271 TaxID=3434550 RepID=UPI003F6E1815